MAAVGDMITWLSPNHGLVHGRVVRVEPGDCGAERPAEWFPIQTYLGLQMVRVAAESVGWIHGHHTAESVAGAALIAAAALCAVGPFANSFPVPWMKEAPARTEPLGVRNGLLILCAAIFSLVFGAESETGNAE